MNEHEPVEALIGWAHNFVTRANAPVLRKFASTMARGGTVLSGGPRGLRGRAVQLGVRSLAGHRRTRMTMTKSEAREHGFGSGDPYQRAVNRREAFAKSSAGNVPASKPEP